MKALKILILAGLTIGLVFCKSQNDILPKQEVFRQEVFREDGWETYGFYNPGHEKFQIWVYGDSSARMPYDSICLDDYYDFRLGRGRRKKCKEFIYLYLPRVAEFPASN